MWNTEISNLSREAANTTRHGCRSACREEHALVLFRSRSLRTILLFLFLLNGRTLVHAAALYWDTNDAMAGCGTGNSDWFANNWSTDPAGTVATTLWVGGSDAVFSAGSDATGSLNITTSSTHVLIGNLSVEEGSINVTGSESIQFSGNQTWTVNPGTSLSVANDLTNNNGRTLTLNSLGDTTLGGTLNGYGSLNMMGTGSLTLSGSNSFAGLTLRRSAEYRQFYRAQRYIHHSRRHDRQYQRRGDASKRQPSPEMERQLLFRRGRRRRPRFEPRHRRGHAWHQPNDHRRQRNSDCRRSGLWQLLLDESRPRYARPRRLQYLHRSGDAN